MASCCACCCFVTMMIVLVATVLITFVAFPFVLDKFVSPLLVLKEGNPIYDAWKLGSYPSETKIYVFDITNPQKVINGEQAVLRQLGPFRYVHIYEKQITSETDVNIKYKQKNRFITNDTFQDIEANVINLPYLVIKYWARENGLVINNEPEVFPEGTELILKTKVGKLLTTGIKVCGANAPPEICNRITSANFKMIREDSSGKYFSVFGNKFEYDQTFTINSGKEDIKDLGKVIEWNDKKVTDLWDGETCNTVKGTDGVVFPPYLKKSDQLEVFRPDICRSVTYEYLINDNGKAYNYTLKQNLLEQREENKCYCVKQDECVKDGALDMRNCWGSFMVMTYPYFYSADSEYVNGVNFSTIDENTYRTIITLDSFLGFMLESTFKIQYNIFLRKDILQMPNIKHDTLFPILWSNEELIIPNTIKDILYNEVYYYLNLFEIITWSVIGISGILALCFLFCFIFSCCLCK